MPMICIHVLEPGLISTKLRENCNGCRASYKAKSWKCSFDLFL